MLPRHLVFAFGVGLGTLALTAAATATPAKHKAGTGVAPAPGTSVRSLPGIVRLQTSKTNPFAAHSWLPPVAKAKAPPPPPPPRAPALPFVYLGKMQDGAAVTAFVSQGGRSHVLKSGDSVAGYQVESIGANDMVFVYLPLGEKQRLSFGTEN